MNMPEEIELQKDEWIDDLQRNGYKIIQSRRGLRFGTDSVLLADFSRVRKSEKVVDMGAGTGVISLLLAAREPECSITAVEIIPEMARMAEKSVLLNHLEKNITVLEGDARNISDRTGHEFADVVVTNPPYLQTGHGLTSPDPIRAAARGGENSCGIREWIQACSKVLKNGGRLYLIFPASDLPALLAALQAFHIEPKRIRGVAANETAPAKRVLVEGKKNGNPGLLFLPMLITHTMSGDLTEEMKRIYGE